jgi:hypothetical protein
VVAVVGLVVVIPTAQFAGRVGRDLAGEAGYYLGIAVAVVVVVAAAALATRVATALYGTAPIVPAALPTTAADPAPPAG